MGRVGWDGMGLGVGGWGEERGRMRGYLWIFWGMTCCEMGYSDDVGDRLSRYRGKE